MWHLLGYRPVGAGRLFLGGEMKLVIYMTPKRLRQIEEKKNPIEFDDLEGLRGGLPEYGATWAKIWPNDIVMLVE